MIKQPGKSYKGRIKEKKGRVQTVERNRSAFSVLHHCSWFQTARAEFNMLYVLTAKIHYKALHFYFPIQTGSVRSDQHSCSKSVGIDS